VDVYFHKPYGRVFTLWCVGIAANLETNSPSGGIVCSGGNSGGNTDLLRNMFVLESVAPIRLIDMLTCFEIDLIRKIETSYAGYMALTAFRMLFTWRTVQLRCGNYYDFTANSGRTLALRLTQL
jgi:hypothetical protein